MDAAGRTLAVDTMGDNPTRLWGLSMGERVRRIAAAAAGLAGEPAGGDAPRLLTNAAFAFDPSWLRHFATRPGAMLTLGGVPAIAHARNAAEAAAYTCP